MGQKSTENTPQQNIGLRPDQILTLFKFYEEAAEKTKSHAWSQTTWILTLNTGIFAFSLNFYAEHAAVRAYLLIELFSAGVGVVLCGFLVYLLQELGSHISRYWTSSNQIAANYGPLVRFIDKSDAVAARKSDYCAPFPKFCRRLKFLAILFLIAHVGWSLFMVYQYCA
ncbi:MAG: hypothetical protein AYP45_04670 [Candidatus Brocadia carolinensis]|uniref:Uncharacterized protein n=1 Tax=Candidatus Brocadia carolinensis TaxID=1004156 RepID=A0A1V4AVU7_9BACT|nr:MAG: hypothetical protein AYP45_04670 [Candidatus Brocadia caroliniensis]